MGGDVEFNELQDKSDRCCKCWPLATNDATGFLLNRFGTGSVISSNIFLQLSLLYLASVEAGCEDGEDDGNEEDDTVCKLRVYGFRPGSLVTIIATISSLISAFLLPVIGALVDFTPHRKTIFIVFCGLLLTIQSVQIGTIQSTWFIMLILQAINGFFYDGLTLTAQAYLPEIASDVGEKEMTKYTVLFNAFFYISQLGFFIIIAVVTIVFDLDVVRTAQVGQGIDVIITGSSYFASTLFMTKKDAKGSIPENETLIFAGFKQNWVTIKKSYQHYRYTLGWYFIGVILSQSGVQTFTVVTPIYLKEQMDFDDQVISFIFMMVFACIIPGSFLGSYVANKTNPKISMLINLVVFIVMNFIGFLTLSGPDRQVFTWPIGVIWGILIGWYYTMDALMFSLILPKGQEAEFAGFNQYCSQIFRWVPPLIFAAMFEADVNLSWGGIHLNIYFFFAIVFYYFMEPWERIRINAATQMR